MATKLTAKKHAPSSSNNKPPTQALPANPARHHSACGLDDELCAVTSKLQELKKSHALLAQEAERLAAALREQQERLRAVMSTASDAIITIDEAGFIESVNAAAERMFGYTAAELRGQNVKLLMPSSSREDQDSLAARYSVSGDKLILASGREAEARRRDGSTFPLQLSRSVRGWSARWWKLH
jgi:PAS domain S-box-containing protein